MFFNGDVDRANNTTHDVTIAVKTINQAFFIKIGQVTGFWKNIQRLLMLKLKDKYNICGLLFVVYCPKPEISNLFPHRSPFTAHH